MRFDPIIRNGRISYGGASVALSPLPHGKARGCAVIEQIRRPSDVLLNKTLFRLYSPYKTDKAVLSERMDAGRASSVSESIAEAVVRKREGNRVRIIKKGPAVVSSLCLSHKYLAAVLFAPLLRCAARRAANAFIPGGGILARAVCVLWAALPLAALLHVAGVSLKNGFVHYYRAEGMISIARGAVVRRVLHFTPDAAEAGISVETPLTRLMKIHANFIYVNGRGVVAVPCGDARGTGDEREIMRLERHCSGSGTWGGYVLTAIAVSVFALHYAVRFISFWKMTAAALMPAVLLLLYRAIAEALLGGRPAVLLYRDAVVVNGVWGMRAVSATVGRDSIAKVSVTQSVIQKNRGLCDLIVKAAGSPRPLRCRNVDLLRARAFLARLCR